MTDEKNVQANAATTSCSTAEIPPPFMGKYVESGEVRVFFASRKDMWAFNNWLAAIVETRKEPARK